MTIPIRFKLSICFKTQEGNCYWRTAKGNDLIEVIKALFAKRGNHIDGDMQFHLFEAIKACSRYVGTVKLENKTENKRKV